MLTHVWFSYMKRCRHDRLVSITHCPFRSIWLVDLMLVYNLTFVQGRAGEYNCAINIWLSQSLICSASGFMNGLSRMADSVMKDSSRGVIVATCFFGLERDTLHDSEIFIIIVCMLIFVHTPFHVSKMMARQIFVTRIRRIGVQYWLIKI